MEADNNLLIASVWEIYPLYPLPMMIQRVQLMASSLRVNIVFHSAYICFLIMMRVSFKIFVPRFNLQEELLSF